MKALITLLFALTSFTLFAQQKNESFYKDRFLSKQTTEKKANYKRVETINSDGFLNIQIIDLSKQCLIKEENYQNNKPVGVWSDFKEDCSIEQKRDFSKIIYSNKKVDSLFNNVIEEANKGNYQIAQFGNNEDALYKYLISEIKYPAEAKDAGISGTVYVQFIVQSDGRIKMYSIIKAADPFLDYTSWELIESMNKWNPAIKDGKPIDSSFILPIRYVLK